MRFWTLLRRSLLLRCPYCGEGALFRRWFLMHQHCPRCGLKYEREPGFFLGSIYFNYGLTALLVAIVYPVLLFNRVFSESRLLFIFVVLFPMLFFRHARALWLGFDQWYDPRPPETK
jgi:uncharacterized protein (DUF983 family)